MMAEDIRERALALVAREQGLSPDEIPLERPFHELGMDSLDALSLVQALEDEFDVSIPNEEAMGLTTVRAVVESLERLLAGRSAGDPSPAQP